MRKLLFILCCAISIQLSYSQEVEVIDFSAFEQRLAQKDNQLVVYNFWATWCRPCIKELPYFEKIGQDYADKNVKVVLVSLDFPDQLESLVKPFVQKKALQSEILLLDAPNYNDWIAKIDENWAGSIPATLLNMPSKNIYAFKEKDFSYEELTAWIDETLQKL